VRQAMIDDRLCRNTINQRIGRIVHSSGPSRRSSFPPPSIRRSRRLADSRGAGRTPGNRRPCARCPIRRWTPSYPTWPPRFRR
jgi:hypothetical protein